MGDYYTIQTPGHQDQLLDQLHTLQEEGVLCDVTLAAEDGDVMAHKAVLMAASSYFRQKLSKSIATNPSRIVLRGISVTELANLVKYIYTGKMLVSKDTMNVTLELASILEIEGIVTGYKEILAYEQMKQGQNTSESLTMSQGVSSQKNNTNSVEQTSLVPYPDAQQQLFLDSAGLQTVPGNKDVGKEVSPEHSASETLVTAAESDGRAECQFTASLYNQQYVDVSAGTGKSSTAVDAIPLEPRSSEQQHLLTQAGLTGAPATAAGDPSMALDGAEQTPDSLHEQSCHSSVDPAANTDFSALMPPPKQNNTHPSSSSSVKSTAKGKRIIEVPNSPYKFFINSPVESDGPGSVTSSAFSLPKRFSKTSRSARPGPQPTVVFSDQNNVVSRSFGQTVNFDSDEEAGSVLGGSPVAHSDPSVPAADVDPTDHRQQSDPLPTQDTDHGASCEGNSEPETPGAMGVNPVVSGVSQPVQDTPDATEVVVVKPSSAAKPHPVHKQQLAKTIGKLTASLDRVPADSDKKATKTSKTGSKLSCQSLVSEKTSEKNKDIDAETGTDSLSVDKDVGSVLEQRAETEDSVTINQTVDVSTKTSRVITEMLRNCDARVEESGNSSKVAKNSGDAVTMTASSGDAVTMTASFGDADTMTASSGDAVTMEASSGDAVTMVASSGDAITIVARCGDAATMVGKSGVVETREETVVSGNTAALTYRDSGTMVRTAGNSESRIEAVQSPPDGKTMAEPAGDSDSTLESTGDSRIRSSASKRKGAKPRRLPLASDAAGENQSVTAVPATGVTTRQTRRNTRQPTLEGNNQTTETPAALLETKVSSRENCPATGATGSPADAGETDLEQGSSGSRQKDSEMEELVTSRGVECEKTCSSHGDRHEDRAVVDSGNHRSRREETVIDSSNHGDRHEEQVVVDSSNHGDRHEEQVVVDSSVRGGRPGEWAVVGRRVSARQGNKATPVRGTAPRTRMRTRRSEEAVAPDPDSVQIKAEESDRPAADSMPVVDKTTEEIKDTMKRQMRERYTSSFRCYRCRIAFTSAVLLSEHRKGCRRGEPVALVVQQGREKERDTVQRSEEAVEREGQVERVDSSAVYMEVVEQDEMSEFDVYREMEGRGETEEVGASCSLEPSEAKRIKLESSAATESGSKESLPSATGKTGTGTTDSDKYSTMTLLDEEVTEKQTPTGGRRRRTETSCEVCQASFGNRFQLRSHMRKWHVEMKPEHCTHCSQSFWKKVDLYKHMFKLHGVPLPDHYTTYKCELCDYVTWSSNHVKSHMLCHIDDRKYKCEICNHSFKSQFAVNRHQKQHGEKKFPCPEPGCTYKSVCRQRTALHHRVKHAEAAERVHCVLCTYSSPLKGNVDKHIRTVHNLEVVTKHTVQQREKYSEQPVGTILTKDGEIFDPTVKTVPKKHRSKKRRQEELSEADIKPAIDVFDQTVKPPPKKPILVSAAKALKHIDSAAKTYKKHRISKSMEETEDFMSTELEVASMLPKFPHASPQVRKIQMYYSNLVYDPVSPDEVRKNMTMPAEDGEQVPAVETEVEVGQAEEVVDGSSPNNQVILVNPGKGDSVLETADLIQSLIRDGQGDETSQSLGVLTALLAAGHQMQQTG